MRWQWHKLGTLMMLASYLLATFGAGFLHDHSHSHALGTVACDEKPAQVTQKSVHRQCRHSHASGQHSHKVAKTTDSVKPHSHDEPSRQQHPHHHWPWHDDDCSACQYSSLAQWSAPTISVTVALDVVAPVVERYEAEPHSGALRIPQARGPPRS